MPLSAPLTDLAVTVLSTAVVFVAVIALTRAYGLRAFGKLAPYDFAATVAIGSLLAATAASGGVPLLQGVVALATLHSMQRLFAIWQRHGGESLIDDTPRRLVVDGVVLDEPMRAANVTPKDLRGKLREAGVDRREQVRAVVLETTGDISVILDDGGTFDLELLRGVRGRPERLLVSDEDGWLSR